MGRRICASSRDPAAGRHGHDSVGSRLAESRAHRHRGGQSDLRIASSSPFLPPSAVAPAWSARDRDDLLAAIRDAKSDGLDPADYHLASIERTSDPEQRDILVTDAFFLLASHLLSGRVDPESIEPMWCLTPRADDLVAALETALELHEVRAAIMCMPPAHPEYAALRRWLAAYRRIDAAGGWPKIDAKKSLRLGDRGPLVAQLAARLAASGDLPKASDEFDADLDRAVRRFQSLQGLEPDGVVGPRTRAELNIEPAARVRQIELNLERWRWLPADLGDPHALINIPAFSLVVTEHGRTVMSMRIVVGKDYLRTPIFSGDITHVVLSPYWNVPVEDDARRWVGALEIGRAVNNHLGVAEPAGADEILVAGGSAKKWPIRERDFDGFRMSRFSRDSATFGEG